MQEITLVLSLKKSKLKGWQKLFLNNQMTFSLQMRKEELNATKWISCCQLLTTD